jgi:hypothetical protein
MLYHSPPLPTVRFEAFAAILAMPPVLAFGLRFELYYGLFSCHLCLAFSVVQLYTHSRQRVGVLLDNLTELLDMAVVRLRPLSPFLPMDVSQFVEVVNKYGKEYPRDSILC